MNFVRILETKQYIKFCKTGTKLKDLYQNLVDRLAEQKNN